MPELDPEMRAHQAAYDAIAAEYPPILLQEPLDPQRAVNDAINTRISAGGPAMADSADRWVLARGRRVLCRVHRPRADGLLPVLAYFHGGGWVWSSVDTHDRLAREYAVAAGCAVVLVDYALSPEARFPQALLECAGVVRWIAEHGGEWGLDGSRIAVGGDSAGGNLALGTALLLRDEGGPGLHKPALRGVLTSYPVCDSRFDTASYRAFGGGEYWLSEEKMRFYWGVYAGHAADRMNPLAAPLRARLEGLPPVLVYLAELDPLRSDGEAMVGRLRQAGVATEFAVFPGTIHGFMRATERVAKARDAVARGGAWLRGVLQNGS